MPVAETPVGLDTGTRCHFKIREGGVQQEGTEEARRGGGDGPDAEADSGVRFAGEDGA